MKYVGQSHTPKQQDSKLYTELTKREVVSYENKYNKKYSGHHLLQYL